MDYESNMERVYVSKFRPDHKSISELPKELIAFCREVALLVDTEVETNLSRKKIEFKFLSFGEKVAGVEMSATDKVRIYTTEYENVFENDSESTSSSGSICDTVGNAFVSMISGFLNKDIHYCWTDFEYGDYDTVDPFISNLKELDEKLKKVNQEDQEKIHDLKIDKERVLNKISVSKAKEQRLSEISKILSEIDQTTLEEDSEHTNELKRVANRLNELSQNHIAMQQYGRNKDSELDRDIGKLGDKNQKIKKVLSQLEEILAKMQIFANDPLPAGK